jgi:hypothetical protein
MAHQAEAANTATALKDRNDITTSVIDVVRILGDSQKMSSTHAAEKVAGETMRDRNLL